ncbi:hypothetical protein [Streptomyces sp. H27-C3]|uniref:hypothetical protein n=1 Tax=Streptomyces sp. H27-C3 TaxID=3046305 RepID=UPI0024BB4B9A|nr:hypothetical protein [Streptomyces sp. H27-C3]MDJ0465404.1 hypothetical protein [Streptomyces sp. H27-C3]
MRQPQVLAHGARLVGAVLCALLALQTAAWIGRDLGLAEPSRLWPLWTGGGPSAPDIVTTFRDPLLFCVYVVVGIAALRSTVAASALLTAGIATLAWRLPGVWARGSDGMHHELREQAVLSTFVALALGAALLVTAAAGRRPTVSVYEPRPTRPARGPSVTAFLLLGAAASVVAAWEVHWATRSRDPVAYLDRFTGSDAIRAPLLGAPPGWLAVALVLMAWAAAIGALLHTVYSRPLGMVAAALLAGTGGTALADAMRGGALTDVGSAPTSTQLQYASALFELLAGTVVLLALARRGVPPAIRPTTTPRALAPPPPASRPPGW